MIWHSQGLHVLTFTLALASDSYEYLESLTLSCLHGHICHAVQACFVTACIYRATQKKRKKAEVCKIGLVVCRSLCLPICGNEFVLSWGAPSC